MLLAECVACCLKFPSWGDVVLSKLVVDYFSVFGVRKHCEIFGVFWFLIPSSFSPFLFFSAWSLDGPNVSLT
jgi:hypothetical protein